MASSNLDSVAVFEARASEIGLEVAELEYLRSRRWNSFGRLAFACNYTPGQSDETPLAKLAAAITKSDSIESIPEDRFPVIRRLFVEAYTMASADLRTRVERRDDDPPRRLAAPERASRG